MSQIRIVSINREKDRFLVCPFVMSWGINRVTDRFFRNLKGPGVTAGDVGVALLDSFAFIERTGPPRAEPRGAGELLAARHQIQDVSGVRLEQRPRRGHQLQGQGILGVRVSAKNRRRLGRRGVAGAPCLPARPPRSSDRRCWTRTRPSTSGRGTHDGRGASRDPGSCAGSLDGRKGKGYGRDDGIGEPGGEQNPVPALCGVLGNG